MKLNASDEAGAQAVIKAWNSTASRASQLVGAKAVGVRNIINLMPAHVRELVSDHINRLGWDNSALSDDVLQNKKLYPPYVYRATSKEWTARGKVTSESMHLVVQHLLNGFERTPVRMRRKIDNTIWEETSSAAAALVSFLADLKAACPIPEDTISKEIIQTWVNGGSQLKVELAEAVREKVPTFKWADIQAFSALVEQHRATTPLATPSALMASGTLEDNAMDLTMRQITYDLQAVNVWAGKVRNIEQHAFHVRLEAQQQAAQSNKLAGETFLNSTVMFLPLTKTDHVMRELSAIQKNFESRGCARDPNELGLATICLLNWVAPSMVSSVGMETQAEVASCLLHQSSQNVGVLLSPMFAYKKGGVWAAEKHAMSLLTDKSVLLERSWSLLFSEQHDKRDSRPLQYRGRIMEPPTASPTQSWWRTSKIFRGYTDTAQQMAARDMVFPEDVMHDALPQSVDDSVVTVQGAATFQQIGTDAAKQKPFWHSWTMLPCLLACPSSSLICKLASVTLLMPSWRCAAISIGPCSTWASRRIPWRCVGCVRRSSTSWRR